MNDWKYVYKNTLSHYIKHNVDKNILLSIKLFIAFQKNLKYTENIFLLIDNCINMTLQKGGQAMQKVILSEQIPEIAAYMQPDAPRYISESQIESFEGFETFNLLAFDWYDIHSERTLLSKILIYMDKSNMFFICSDKAAAFRCREILEELLAESSATNEQLLYRFFIRLFRGDMEYLDSFETQTNDLLTALLSGKLDNVPEEVIEQRRELLRLKRYYEQIDLIFDEIQINDNKLLSEKTIKRLTILGARTDRYLNKVSNLQELVSQIQETYQSQLSIQQNDLMKIFTVITAIFLPLTLIVGWYGMNFVYMPELQWPYSYPVMIVISCGIVIALVCYFKYKKWL